MRQEKCYVLYADEAYHGTVTSCAKSIRQFSEVPIYVYMMNSDLTIDVDGTETIRWDCEVMLDESPRYSQHGTNFYINRANKSVYSMLIQRPLVVKHALENFADVAAYVDSDSVATKNADRIFDRFDASSDHPAFVEGIYDILFLGNRGGIYGEDYTKSLEHHACDLFGVDQKVRKKYRQTGYFVSGKECMGFLEEWYQMCSNPFVMQNCWLYAPFNEETIANVLLWKKKIFDGLPYVYVNIGATSIEEIYSVGFSGQKNHIREWVAIPSKEEDLMFFHGEKNPESMDLMAEELKKR
jgi:hypothetical protein